MNTGSIVSALRHCHGVRGWSGAARAVRGTLAAACAAWIAACSIPIEPSGGAGIAKATTGNLTVTPDAPWVVDATPGSGFAGATQAFTLQNAANYPIDWGVRASEPWLVVETAFGQLPGASTRTLNVSIDAQGTAALATGEYRTKLMFLNLTDGQPSVSVPVTVSIGDAVQALTVTPPEGLLASGPVGGPFQPDAADYTLENTSQQPLDYSVALSEAWILPTGATQGNLSVGASANLKIGIDQVFAATLAAGVYVGNVDVLDASSGATLASREVRLEVQDPNAGAGWTVLTPSADTRTVYVSSSQGDDANDGLSASTPKKSIGAARALLRDGYPDWLLLKKGDAWDYTFDRWTTSGRSATEPQVLSSYGSGARPHVRTGNQTAIMTLQGGKTPPNTTVIAHVAIVGVHFQADNYSGWVDTPVGLRLLLRTDDWLIEDCKIEGFYDGLVIQGAPGSEHRNVRVRRNVVVDCDAFDPQLKPQGLYATHARDVLIEENLFDRMGLSTPTIYRHALYIDSEGNSNFTVRGNILARTSSHGLQLRPGGTVEDNLFVRTPIAMTLGSYESSQPTSVCVRNVILDGVDTAPGLPRGWGITFDNSGQALVEDNIVANAPNAGNGRPIEVNIISASKSKDITFRGNVVYCWPGKALNLQFGAAANQNIRIENNELRTSASEQVVSMDDPATAQQVQSAGNSFFTAAKTTDWFQVGSLKDLNGYKSAVGDASSTSSTNSSFGFPSPSDRTIENYNATLGGPKSLDDFLKEVRLQSKDNWRPQYTAAAVNAWVRAGFGK